MTLKKYYKKRRFKKTPEPKGKAKETGRNRFVVHKHQARHLHYDFRLEMEGVLKSWAVPKGPPKRPGVKRLAVQVEDHPVDYINFHGIIPAGQYGAGKVEIWDKGKFILKPASPARLVKRAGGSKTLKALKFELKGKKLKGDYALVKFKDKNWLLYKLK